MTDLFVRLNLSKEAGPYQSAISILNGDLRKICEYIEPVDDNLKVYSHRIYELYIRTCTEWESLCKDALIVIGATKNPENMNISDYVTLEKSLNLEYLEIGISFWNPKPKYIRPYQGWAISHPPLNWYQDHHMVKHNRNAKFEHANFHNLLSAITALFALHVRVNFVARGSGDTERNLENQKEYTFKNQLFSLRDDIKLLKSG